MCGLVSREYLKATNTFFIILGVVKTSSNISSLQFALKQCVITVTQRQVMTG